MKQITVLYDMVSNNCLSFAEVKEALEGGQENITTNCINFASFDYLKMGYDVVVLKWLDGTGIVLSELLENNRPYIDKEIRLAHNVPKMIIAGGIKFLPLLPRKE